MKINALNINRYNIKPYNFQKRAAGTLFKNSALSFNSLACAQKTDIDVKKLQETDFFEEFMDKKGKVTKEEYEDIKKNHPSILLKAQKLVNLFYMGNTTPKEMAEISLAASKVLDEGYKNCRIISLGTSPAPLAEQLQNLGYDVVFLPVSSFDFSDNNSKEIRMLVEYLKSKNIKDGKTNIILDYTNSGTTLNAVTKLIKKELKCKNVEKKSLNDLLGYICKAKHTHTANYSEDMYFSYIEAVSNVPHFPVTKSGVRKYQGANRPGTIYAQGLTSEQLFEKFDTYSTPLARCFSLCTIAEIDKKKERYSYESCSNIV